MKLKQIVSNLLKSGKRNSPNLCVAVGCGMFALTIYEVWKKAPKVHAALLDAKAKKLDEKMEVMTVGEAQELETLDDIKLNPIETIKVVVPIYWKAGVYGGLSLTCFIAGNHINNRRYAALAAAYGVAERNLIEYKEKTKKIAGEKVEQKIRDELAKDEIESDPPTEKELMSVREGKTLCKDAYTGQYFLSTVEEIKRIENELNHRLISEMFIGINDYLIEVGAEAVKLGDSLGWNIDDGLISFSIAHHNVNGQHLMYVDYDISPQYNYGRLL